MASEPQRELQANQDSPESSIIPTPSQDKVSSTISPTDDGAQRAHEIRVIREQSFFAGPLPHPSILKQYEDIVPGAADRIIKQAEQQTNHRIQLENKVIDADLRRADCGLWAGLAVALVSIIGGGGLILAGHDTAGTAIATATVVSLAGVFVYGSRSRKQERQDRAKLMSGQAQSEPTSLTPHNS